MRVAALNFSGNRILQNLTSSTGVDGTANDKRDRGIDSGSPAVTGISSAPVTLGPGDTAPVGESDFAGGVGNPSAVTVDAREDILIDFGFQGVPTVVTVDQFGSTAQAENALLLLAGGAALAILAGMLAYTVRRRRERS